MIPLNAIPCIVGVVGGNFTAAYRALISINQSIVGNLPFKELVAELGRDQLRRIILTIAACIPLILEKIPTEWLKKLNINKDDVEEVKQEEVGVNEVDEKGNSKLGVFALILLLVTS